MADVNYYSIASNPSPVDLGSFLNPANPLDYSDIIHLSKGVNVTIHDVTVQGGKEDCIDMNNDSQNVLIQNVRVHPNGQYGFTIKGGTRDVVLRNVVFETHGNTVDIDLGNWSDQDQVNKTRAVTLENVTSVDGRPVKVRVMFADNPTVIGGNVKVTVIPGWIVSIIRWFHRFI